MTTQKTTPEAQAAATAAASATAPADDFDSVFAEITKDEGKGDAKPAGDAAAPAAAGAADAGTGNAADAAVAAAEAAAAGADEAGAPAAGAAPVTPEPDSDAAKLAASQARVAELEAAAAVAAKKTETPAAEVKTETPAAAAEEKPIEWYKPTDEEATALAAYEKEWPEISAAEAIRTKAAVYNAVQYVFAQFAKSYAPRIEAIEAIVPEVENFIVLNELRTAHKDYDDVREKVVQWTDTLPGPFKKAAQATLKNGTPDEVSELFAEYKKAHPTQLAVVAGVAGVAPAAPAAKGKTELSAAAKKAAVALTAVDSKRTTQAAAADPSDFEGAWAEATAN